jgi:hypothetical protein
MMVDIDKSVSPSRSGAAEIAGWAQSAGPRCTTGHCRRRSIFLNSYAKSASLRFCAVNASATSRNVGENDASCGPVIGRQSAKK